MKKIIYTIISCFILIQSSFTQEAPDFTFGDTDGNEHNLYHALDQGFIVLLDFFFVNCPPCQETSPELQTIQEDYDGKNVVIFSISDRDSDASVEQFEEELGLDLISGGINGGGDQVLAIYEDEFDFLGWPTFAVICPDKSIDWDIFPIGIGASELRDAIEACGVVDTPPYQPINPVSTITVFESNREITFSPNPVLDVLNLEFHWDNQGLIEINFFNSVGQKMKMLAFENLDNKQLKSIYLGALPAGIYFLEISLNGAQKLSRKIIKL